MSKIQIESNSQHPDSVGDGEASCVYHVKDTNRKQFTTQALMDLLSRWLCLSCQRYKSKAIHNKTVDGRNAYFVVFIMSKIQIESNSQLGSIRTN